MFVICYKKEFFWCIYILFSSIYCVKKNKYVIYYWSTFVQNLLAKYDPKTRRLSLDNFIVACVQIQRLTTSFKTRDREMRGQATMAYEDFIGVALGAHNWIFHLFCKDFSASGWKIVISLARVPHWSTVTFVCHLLQKRIFLVYLYTIFLNILR